MSSPSEPRSISTNHRIRNPGSCVSEIAVRNESNICFHCGANSGVRRARPCWAWDLILGCLSGVLLVSLLLLIGGLLNSWRDRIFDPAFNHWVWHEPLDDWNL